MTRFQPGTVPDSVTLAPVTTRSRPFTFPAGIGERLVGYGYVEEEFIVAGGANVYGPDRPDADPFDRYAAASWGAIDKHDVPYRTRILVRRPTDPARFNGIVHVEPLHNMHELSPDWNIARDWIIRTGAAWVGITCSAGSRLGGDGRRTGGVAVLRSWDADRYGALELDEGDVASWPFLAERDDVLLSEQVVERLKVIDWMRPLADLGLTLATQEMLRTFAHSVDIVKQVTTLLKSDREDNPLTIGTARRAYVSGASGTGVYLHTFLWCGHHDSLADGRPIFDAYVPMVTGPPAGIPLPDDAVVVGVVSEHEVLGIAGQGLELPPDSDGPRYRYYEIPGAGHGMHGPEPIRPSTDSAAEVYRFRSDGEDGAPGHRPHYDKPDHPIFHAIWHNIDKWIAEDVPMPTASRIERDPTARDGIRRDEVGNALGGLRPPWIEVPDAQYADCPEHPFESCMRSLTPAELTALGLDPTTRDRLVRAHIQTMVEHRLLLADDVPIYLDSVATSGTFDLSAFRPDLLDSRRQEER